MTNTDDHHDDHHHHHHHHHHGHGHKKHKEAPPPAKLSRPAKKTTMVADKAHPQLASMRKREKEKPAENLEIWFDYGLVKQEVEGSKEHHVAGARPLPSGYNGCTSESILVHSDGGVCVWPVRIDTDGIGSDGKRPWTLYHYCHEASFEIYHRICHDMYGNDRAQLRQDLFQQLQVDYRERVPNPVPTNAKGEPMLSLVEPVKFASKQDALSQLFTLPEDGFSKQGNRYGSFADYCVAVRVPASACFIDNSMVSQSNVRVCKETLEQLTRRLEYMKEEAEQRKHEHYTRAKRKDSQDDKAEPGGWCGLCGAKTQAKMEHWDEHDDQETKQKKKPREKDAWKERMAKKWLDEHVQNVAEQAAQEQGQKDQEAQRRSEAEKKARDDRRGAAGKKHQGFVVAEKRGTVINDLEKDMKRGVVGYFQQFDFVAKALGFHKPDKGKTQTNVDQAAIEVLQSSALYRQPGTPLAFGSQASLATRHSIQVQEDVLQAKAADGAIKRNRRSSVVEPKGVTGNKRRARRRKVSRKSKDQNKLTDKKDNPDEAHEEEDEESSSSSESEEEPAKKDSAEKKESAASLRSAASAKPDTEDAKQEVKSPRKESKASLESSEHRKGSKSSVESSGHRKGSKNSAEPRSGSKTKGKRNGKDNEEADEDGGQNHKDE